MSDIRLYLIGLVVRVEAMISTIIKCMCIYPAYVQEGLKVTYFIGTGNFHIVPSRYKHQHCNKAHRYEAYGHQPIDGTSVL